MTSWHLQLGKVESVLPTLPANSFDGCLCDPPYGLSFMGKAWDYKVPKASTWREVLRVLKPGAPLIAFSSGRTYHRAAVEVEDAGFEIHDMFEWLYGTGFPKSRNVSKDLDGRADWAALERFQDIVRSRRKALGLSQSEAARRCGLLAADAPRLAGGGWMWFETGRVPTAAEYLRLRQGLGLGPEADGAFQAVEREVVGQYKTDTPGLAGERFEAGSRDITADASPLAKLWSGYGTALKPGHEPAVMASKPIEGTIAQNIAKWGVGALNIGGCLLEGDRWPTNVLLDEGAAADVDAQSPGASRFFYTAKPSRKEREAGCDHLPLRTAAQMTNRDDADAALDSPRTGAGRTSGARNFHPTVKPIALMEHLARLLLPAGGGTILVPYAGSGSEMIGCLRAGWGNVFGIEWWSPYVHIERARLAAEAA